MTNQVNNHGSHKAIVSNNIVRQQGLVSHADRQQQAGHQSVILWFTGLSGAGKSTLAHAIEKTLFDRGCRTYVFDGDNVRHGLCADLGFSAQDRQENIRRIGEMSKLFIEAGIIALTAFISPFQSDRDRVRSLVGDAQFIEIYCQADINNHPYPGSIFRYRTEGELIYEENWSSTNRTWEATTYLTKLLVGGDCSTMAITKEFADTLRESN